jgi:hypothetical protein
LIRSSNHILLGDEKALSTQLFETRDTFLKNWLQCLLLLQANFQPSSYWLVQTNSRIVSICYVLAGHVRLFPPFCPVSGLSGVQKALHRKVMKVRRWATVAEMDVEAAVAGAKAAFVAAVEARW